MWLVDWIKNKLQGGQKAVFGINFDTIKLMVHNYMVIAATGQLSGEAGDKKKAWVMQQLRTFLEHVIGPGLISQYVLTAIVSPMVDREMVWLKNQLGVTTGGQQGAIPGL